tara:strand:- start:22953 stop:23129 length:177 start_codon:yes stop_codon:yes gene_type:complete
MGCGCGKKQIRRTNKTSPSKPAVKKVGASSTQKSAKIASKGSAIRKARLTRLISPPRK